SASCMKYYQLGITVEGPEITYRCEGPGSCLTHTHPHTRKRRGLGLAQHLAFLPRVIQ
ncbi:hypothetical protein J6590_061895, partial [Homalodisca vitripennis]